MRIISHQIENEISKRGKYIETEIRSLVSRGWGKERQSSDW